MSRRPPLRRRLILGSAVFGLIFAQLTIAGWIHGWEGPVALAILALVALIVALRAPGRPVIHGFLTGLLAALVAIELQALFLPIYFANNPGYAEIEIPLGLSARVATAVLGPINALIAGAITALLTWLFSRSIRRWGSASSKPDPSPED